MIFYLAALLTGFVGGMGVGATVHGRWRLRLLWLWLTLPLTIYTGIMFWGGVEGGRAAWAAAVGWWLIGLVGYLGLPMLLFACSGAFGYFVAPAPKGRWSLKDWRLPQ